jgi:membrane protein YdbS with pleckstrin-like domain
MRDDAKLEAAHVDLNPVATVDEARAAQLELLEKNEIVELSIKPSLWFIAVVSARVVALVAILAAAVVFATRDSGLQVATYGVSLAVLAIVLRIVVASLQWASRVYVLTNRRVMRFSGILSVDIAECALTRIGGTSLHADTLQRVVRLGSVSMSPREESQPEIVWEHVARPSHIHERVVRAIRRAQSGKP